MQQFFKKINIFTLVLFFLGLSFFILSCKIQDKDTINPLINSDSIIPEVQDIFDIMTFTYLWENQVDQNINLIAYSEPISLVADLRVEEDQFTFIQEGTSVQDALAGTPLGNGINLRYLDDTLYVSYVEPNSPADLAGFKRGNSILRINDNLLTPAPEVTPLVNLNETISITYLDENGFERTTDLIPKEYATSAVIHQEIKQLSNSKKIGYLVYATFSSSSMQELTDAFVTFQTENIDELILDLRYNSGGSVRISQHLASLINNQLAGELFLQLLFSSAYTTYLESEAPQSLEDAKYPFQNISQALNLDRLFILTDRFTASASELIINGLSPFMEVILIGRQTVGKNLGSFVYTIEGSKTYTFLPITFRTANSEGNNDYGDGFTPNFSTFDNVKESFGSLEENMLAQAIYYIENGSFDNDSPNLRLSLPSQKVLNKPIIDRMIIQN